MRHQLLNRYGAILTLLLLFLSPSAWTYPGKVVVKGNEIRWGQYKNIRGIRAVESVQTAKHLADNLWKWPASGASVVVLRCQEPGERFFASDGESIPSGHLERVKQGILSANSLDMLPIVLVFDPSLECQLDSPEAYGQALSTLLSQLGSDGWYLLAISDQLDHPDWRIQDPASDPVFIAQDLARMAKETHPQLVVAAGSGSTELNQKLLEEKGAIDVLIGRGDSLGSEENLIDSDSIPVIETLVAGDVTEKGLEKAVDRIGFRRIGESFPFGFAVLFEGKKGTSGNTPEDMLKMLAPIVDRSQKKISGALPPSDDMNATLDPKETEEGFVSLFNGRDLSGWVPISKPGNFAVREGCMTVDLHSGGWLRSWDSYEDFILRAEYWIKEGGNSGIFIRAPYVGRCSRIGFEFQIMGQDPEVPLTNDVTGSIYDVRPPEAIFIKPGEWNEVEIQCIGTEVKITWNGHLAHHFHYEDVEKMKHRAHGGHIGLQDHYNEVKFRNLRIKRLN